MLFYWVKIIHIVTASLLFGVGIGTAAYLFFMNRSRDWVRTLKATKQVGLADWLFTAVAGVIQPITGFMLIYLKGYVLSPEWWAATLLGYCVAGVCWFPAIYCRAQCEVLLSTAIQQHENISSQYHRYFNWRCALSALAFVSLLMVFYFMASIPQS